MHNLGVAGSPGKVIKTVHFNEKVVPPRRCHSSEQLLLPVYLVQWALPGLAMAACAIGGTAAQFAYAHACKV